MAKKPHEWPPHVGLITDYENKEVCILVVGKNGTLSLKVHTEAPTISVPDPKRGPLRYKAVAELLANGHLKGWFVERKGATPREDTLVFFPARKGRKPLPEARRVKE
ncbi:MAG TPA: hypothetical protein VGX03_21135 [Candidatus Binatia bacterium]|jgi:hypothetical protein|nr:hypothetical protein [Candidatus Binatia bacterium]